MSDVGDVGWGRGRVLVLLGIGRECGEVSERTLMKEGRRRTRDEGDEGYLCGGTRLGGVVPRNRFICASLQNQSQALFVPISKQPEIRDSPFALPA